MASAIHKITLSSSRDIPFNKLVLSQANVRRVKAGVSVEELAESIARRGLIQSLHVRPVLDADGQETGQFEVPAGGRRFRALELLVRQKRLAKTAPVPCVLSEAQTGTPHRFRGGQCGDPGRGRARPRHGHDLGCRHPDLGSEPDRRGARCGPAHLAADGGNAL